MPLFRKNCVYSISISDDIAILFTECNPDADISILLLFFCIISFYLVPNTDLSIALNSKTSCNCGLPQCFPSLLSLKSLSGLFILLIPKYLPGMSVFSLLYHLESFTVPASTPNLNKQIHPNNLCKTKGNL